MRGNTETVMVEQCWWNGGTVEQWNSVGGTVKQ